MISESGEEESNGEDSDSAMSKYDDPDKPDDSMTLDQFQSWLHKKALVRLVL